MLKKSFLAVLALGAMQFANAQEIDSVVTKEVKTADKYVVETNHFGDNWFISLQGGANMIFADHTNSFERVTQKGERTWGNEFGGAGLNIDLNFGKWFTPGIGTRLGLAYGNLRGWNGTLENNRRPDSQNIGKSRFGFIDDVNKPTRTNVKYINAHADLMFNISQMIHGYDQERFYSFIPYASLGFYKSVGTKPVSLNNYDSKYGTLALAGGFGILNRFKVSNRFDITLDIAAKVADDRFDGQIGGNGFWGAQFDGVASATLGVVYNIGKNYWDRSTITTVRVNENVLNDLRERVGQLELTNDDLRKQLEEALNREVTPENVCGMPLLVTFRIDRWKLRNKDRVNLGFLAERIKANPKMIYSVTGFADKGTGSVRRNIFLARKRSEVIYNCLVKEFGVSEAQLKRDSKGGVANMYYNDPRCSRAVLVKLAE